MVQLTKNELVNLVQKDMKAFKGHTIQGTLTEREGFVQLTSSLR